MQIRLWLTNVNLSPEVWIDEASRKRWYLTIKWRTVKTWENVVNSPWWGMKPWLFLGMENHEILNEINESNDRNYPWRDFMTCVWFSFFTIGFYQKHMLWWYLSNHPVCWYERHQIPFCLPSHDWSDRHVLHIPKYRHSKMVASSQRSDTSDKSRLGGGFKYVLFSPLFGEMIQFD